MTTETVLLKQIAENIVEIKDRLIFLETSFNEINTDLHRVRPEYIQKLKRIEEEGTISLEEFEKKLDVKI